MLYPTSFMTKTSTNESGLNTFESIYVDQIYSGANGTVTINDPMTVKGDILPDLHDMWKVGNDSLKFKSMSSLYDYIPANFCGTAFTAPNIPAMAGGITTVLQLAITNAAYNGTSNGMKFPQRGYYIVSVQLGYDHGGSPNPLTVALYLSNAGITQVTHTFDTAFPPPVVANFGLWVDNNNTDNFQIRVKSTLGVTNLDVSFGRIILCSSYE